MITETVWRESTRIRRADGTGYSDRVSDGMIRAHIEQHEAEPADHRFIAFAEAVLAIRKFERLAAATSPVPETQ